jgi:release factor glutamine methyltransferase
VSHNIELFAALTATLSRDLVLLPDKPEETVESTLRALWYTSAGAPKSAVSAMEGDLPSLLDGAADRLRQLVDKRLQGVPLSHLTGRQRFFGIEMLSGPDALVPRKETELLAQSVIGFAQAAATDAAHEGRTLRILDICTGSGNVALAAATNLPTAIVAGADLSAAAVGLARRNADHLGLGSRVQFVVSDLLAAFDSAEFLEGLDVLSCNPPYINSAKVGTMPQEIAAHEPRLAFDGGSLGISILMRLIADAPRFLRVGGWLTFEVGLGQGKPIAKRLHASNAYREVHTATDHEGNIRVVSAQR